MKMQKTQSVTISANSGSTVDFTTKPHERLELTDNSPNVTTKMHVEGSLTLTVESLAGTRLNSYGGTIRFIGDSSFGAQSRTVFDNNLTGNGTLTLRGGPGETSFVEVKDRVGSGLTFSLPALQPGSVLQIDQPHEFHAALALSLGSEVDFVGLHATHADLRDDMLLMFDGRKLVDAIRVSSDGNLQLVQGSAGVILLGEHNGGAAAGTAIPLHVCPPYPTT